MHAINTLVLVYVILTSTVIIISRARHKKWYQLYLFLNGGIILWELLLLVMPVHSVWLKILYDWTPLSLLPLLYRETEVLTATFTEHQYDDAFIRLEKKYFPYVINFHRTNRASSLILSEFLHLCYLSFYLFIYGIPLFFYLQQDYFSFYECQFATLLVLFLCYFTHSFIPVCGPRNIFDKINDHRRNGAIFRITHKILQDGSITGTAFPSGHTAVSTIVLLTTWHLGSPVFYYIFPFGIGLILSTIYGRFHYMTDMIVGIIYALTAFFIATSFISYT